MSGTTTMKRGASLAAIAALIGVAAPLTMMGGSAQAKAGDVKSGPSLITAISPTSVTLANGYTATITPRTQIDGFGAGVMPKVGDCVKVTDRLPIDNVAHEIDNEPGDCG